MQVSWLHISDFHIRAGGDPYDRDVVLKALVRSVRDYRKQGRVPDLIFATGDIAFSGKAAEYELATKFFEDLLEAAGLEKRRLFVIPGNHDVDRDLGIGLARTLGTREESDAYFNPARPKPHLTQKMGAFIAWYDKFFEGIRAFPKDSTCGPVEMAEVRGHKLGILPINSALFCVDDDDHNKLLIGRRCLEPALEQLSALKADLRIALIHHPLEWLNPVEGSNIKASLQSGADCILRGHLHETEVEHVASAYGESIFCAAGAAYQTRKWPNRALYATVREEKLRIFPTRYEDQPKEIWTVDPSLFPSQEKNFELVFSLQRSTPESAPPVPETPVLPKFRSNVPSRGDLKLIGRDEDLNAMLRLLGDPHKQNVLTLHGHSGAGKSELAKEFARRYRDRYPGGIFVMDATSGSLAVEFARIGRTILGLNFAPDLSISEQGQRTFFSMGEVPVLLIYDNFNSVESVREWLPPSGMICHMLLTCISGDCELGWAYWKVKPLSPADSLKLIEELGGREVAGLYGGDLAELSGGLPVQICPAARALAYEQRRGRLQLAKLSLAPEADRSFHLVYDLLDTSERLLLHCAAFLNHQRIPRDELAIQLKEALSWSDGEFQKTLDVCLDLHLLEGSGELKMHQLFAAFVLSIKLASDQAALVLRVRAKQAARLIELAQEVGAHPNRADFASTLNGFPLDLATWENAGVPISVAEGETIGSALSLIGRFDEALPWSRRAVVVKENVWPDDVVDYEGLSNSLHEVGYCLSSRGKYEEAQPYYERAVAAAEKGDVHGRVDHQSVSVSLQQVGLCLSARGRYEEALPYYERAVMEAEKGDVHGRVNHASLGVSLHEVGFCLSARGRYEEAQPYYERAVAAGEKGDVHGRVDHASVSVSLHQMGACLLDSRKYEEAQPYYERAVAAAEKGDVHGRIDHARLGSSLHLVGWCLAARGRYEEAQSYYERAVAAAEKGDVHGRVNHASLGRSLYVVAECLSVRAKYKEAQPYYERAVMAKRKGNIFEVVDNQSLALSLRANAKCLRTLNRLKEAEVLENEAAELDPSAE